MKIVLQSLILCLILTSINGCALIATGLYQNVHIATSEPSSEVFVNQELTDTTPCELKVRRSYKNPPQIVVRKKGFYEESVDLKKKINPHVWLNFINIPGWAIDFATGASVRYAQPDTIIQKAKRKK